MPDGGIVPIDGACSLGRSSKNTVCLLPESVSRCHAMIQVQNSGQYWLVDLGSTWGTYLNDRRLVQPRRLGDSDQITIGDQKMVFRTVARAEPGDAATGRTVTTNPSAMQTTTRVGWLMLADIEGFTTLSHQLPDDQLAHLVGNWVRTCRDAIEQHGGAINNYLGDAVLAYWWHDDATPARIAATLMALRPAQTQASPPFRLIVHFGPIIRGYGRIPRRGMP